MNSARVALVPATARSPRRLLLLFATLLAAMPNSVASACECIRMGPDTRESLLRGASAAFIGRPVSVICVYDGSRVVAFDYVFEVSRAWLPIQRQVTVRTPFSTCGFLFEARNSYLVIGYGKRRPVVERCSATAPEADSAALVSLLGKPEWRFRQRRRPPNRMKTTPECLSDAAQ
jgi:hypothetical protein